MASTSTRARADVRDRDKERPNGVFVCADVRHAPDGSVLCRAQSKPEHQLRAAIERWSA
ncbi:MAG: hypothetical protein JWN48_175 [Myxococcaceae bacterium]|nr:hypothetical protein [Myxococcaceae bacterium]